MVVCHELWARMNLSIVKLLEQEFCHSNENVSTLEAEDIWAKAAVLSLLPVWIWEEADT